MSEELGIPSHTPKSTHRNSNTVTPYPEDEFEQYQVTSRSENDVKQLIREY